MHPRNPYRDPPNFHGLAEAYPPLKPHVFSTPHETYTIDFQNDVSQRRLTEALLHRDFGLSLVLPNNRLCPPIPNRLNYVLWVQDIIRATVPPSDRHVRGIDIGTGASAIYPLLACKLEPHWEFIATDIDQESIQNAQNNVASNGLADRIKIFTATPGGQILAPLSHDINGSFDFTMCNPPFYSSPEDVARSAEAKLFAPNAVCTGADVEMITPGGETAFVSQIVQESLDHRLQCQWYTSMVGKLSSLSEIVALLRSSSIPNYGITEFVQGQTRRWAIAWSFHDTRLPDSFSQIPNPNLRGIMPDRNTLRQSYPQAASPPQLTAALKSVLTMIDGVSLQDDLDSASLMAQATSNTWSRAARRKAKANEFPAILEPTLKCRIFCTADLVLEFSWVKGKERQMFESFCSHVNRKVATVLSGETNG